MDVSLGGCYIRALGTCLPETLLDVALEACGQHIELKGRVAVSGSSKGMGIEFVSGCDGLKDLLKFVDAVRRRYYTAPPQSPGTRDKDTRSPA